MKLWTMPEYYYGEVWPATYVFLSRNRDSDDLTESNFDTALATLGGESETVTVVRESHWAVGWIEWIAIHQDDTKAVAVAEELERRLEQYPVLDENDWSEREDETAQRIWENCYTWQDRIEYIRDYPGEVEFHDYADLIGCVRGRYFCGHASALIRG